MVSKLPIEADRVPLLFEFMKNHPMIFFACLFFTSAIWWTSYEINVSVQNKQDINWFQAASGFVCAGILCNIIFGVFYTYLGWQLDLSIFCAFICGVLFHQLYSVAATKGIDKLTSLLEVKKDAE